VSKAVLQQTTADVTLAKCLSRVSGIATQPLSGPSDNDRQGRVQADAPNRSIIAQTILGLLRMVTGEDHCNVVFIERRPAGCVDATCEETQRVASHGRISRDGDWPGAWSVGWNTLCINVQRHRESGNDWIVNSVDHCPMNEIA